MSEVNGGKETAGYIYGQVSTGIPVFMDDVMAARDHEDVTKKKNCNEMEETNKFTYGLKNAKYMVMQTGKEDTREITEEVEGGQIGKTETQVTWNSDE